MLKNGNINPATTQPQHHLALSHILIPAPMMGDNNRYLALQKNVPIFTDMKLQREPTTINIVTIAHRV